MQQKSILLSTAYLAPVQYYCKLIQYPEILIEKYENYSKQSYRNRCNIFGANGILPLTLPVVKASRQKTLTKDVRLDYDTNWQKLHWRGIESAYKKSPFFEYYIDDLARFYHKKWEFLWDYNQEILEEICGILEIEPSITFTEDYIESPSEEQIDFRESIHPKISKSQPDGSFVAQPYTQVFSDRHGFLPNLSIIDVIFNLGPDSQSYLESCIWNE